MRQAEHDAGNRRRFWAGIALFLVASSALAQAWLAPKGEASLGVAYQNVYTRDHLFSEGERRDRGHIRLNTVVVGLTYSFTDRLAAGGACPTCRLATMERFRTTSPASSRSTTARITAVHGPAPGSPLQRVQRAGNGHAVRLGDHSDPGLPDVRPVRALLGTRAVSGRRLGRPPARSDSRGRFRPAALLYAFVEKVLGISHDRSNLDLEIGYFLTPSLGYPAIGSYQKTHGGLDEPLAGYAGGRRVPAILRSSRIATSSPGANT